MMSVHLPLLVLVMFFQWLKNDLSFLKVRRENCDFVIVRCPGWKLKGVCPLPKKQVSLLPLLLPPSSPSLIPSSSWVRRQFAVSQVVNRICPWKPLCEVVLVFNNETPTGGESQQHTLKKGGGCHGLNVACPSRVACFGGQVLSVAVSRRWELQVGGL